MMTGQWRSPLLRRIRTATLVILVVAFGPAQHADSFVVDVDLAARARRRMRGMAPAAVFRLFAAIAPLDAPTRANRHSASGHTSAARATPVASCITRDAAPCSAPSIRRPGADPAQALGLVENRDSRVDACHDEVG